MITIRKAEERGHFDFGWLNTYHSFSFGDYYDPKHTRFRTLRVINEDFVQAGHGFPTHGHRDMEIVTYILQEPSNIATAWAPDRLFDVAMRNA